MTEEKTRCRESERRRSGRPLGAAETSKELAEWRSLQWKDLSILGQAKRKGWPQRHKESSWQVRQSHFYQKEKEQSYLSRSQDHEEGESQGE